MLHQHLHNVIALFLILVDNDDGLCIVGYRVLNNLFWVLWQLNVGKHTLNLFFYLVYIYITYYDDGLVVRTIPLLVVCLQEWTLKVVDNLHQSDRHAIAILRTWIELWQIALQHALLSTCAQAPLLVDNATFLLNLFLLKQQTVGPVIQNQQT